LVAGRKRERKRKEIFFSFFFLFPSLAQDKTWPGIAKEKTSLFLGFSCGKMKKIIIFYFFPQPFGEKRNQRKKEKKSSLTLPRNCLNG
jgi:hypothetical protein